MCKIYFALQHECLGEACQVTLHVVWIERQSIEEAVTFQCHNTLLGADRRDPRQASLDLRTGPGQWFPGPEKRAAVNIRAENPRSPGSFPGRKRRTFPPHHLGV